MTTDNLRADLDALPGVATAEIVLRDDETSVARIRLDGTRDGDEVKERVEALLGRSVPSVVLPRQTPRRKRIGLGRGLGDLIPNDEQHPAPAELRPSAVQPLTIVRVAVIESANGVAVEIEDATGGIYSEPVDDEGDIDGAVMNGVLSMVDRSDEMRIDITDVETGDGFIVLVSAFRDDRRSVGAAFVEYGRPYAVARAGLAALCDL
ncbi:MAG: hypothetical protein BMS9Abin12_2195 [Acidimicrobiia bacterium]|nr:MAG: hypothetical protein BMS9Abin12_2195 [Acidimicrobiia bacterium]